MNLNLHSCERAPEHDKSDRMTSEAFRAALHDIGYGVREFAAFTGANPRTVRRWIDGEQDISPWVIPFMAMVKMLSDLGWSAEMIEAREKC